MPIYANYAAGSPALSEAAAAELYEYLGGLRLNAGRNFEGLEAGTIALRARAAVARLFGVHNPLAVIFTSGATLSLNMAINGLVRPGCHVVATSVEHNAAARPLEGLRKNGVIELDWLRCAPDGSLDGGDVRKALKKNTRLLVMTHASNVLGTILPVKECFNAAREHGAFTILDTAQTGGVLPLAMGECCDILVFAGHKGLGGLGGTGGFALGDAVCGEMLPWIRGGTGSASDSLDMPNFLPDRFEPGTQNAAGILSLAASVEEILRLGVEKIRDREKGHTARFLAGLRGIKKVKPLGTLDPERSVAVVSLTVEGYDAGEVSRLLFERHGIITRSGLHCSPLAHETCGTFPGGTVRFSFGRGTQDAEVDAILDALSAL
ncbi:MAG: aminotransferase class V-fold PLP-dependent enzyme [Spirochaetaceae bacterium]|jgi:cysteine desulfurase family protein|nr:aminotransferase class V-fold PLP-dependent enzyme [Spirochaetaceae bacterium]